MAAISDGTRLGPYEVLALIGAGGMGEVYRARDMRLGRIVALKILPGLVSATAQARERFEREARAISALNHPNICTLYDVGNEKGVEYLVMELIDGESLADRISRGPLPLDSALGIAASIADGLDRAHRTGIIHRDLKPGNIMLTKSGPKLLDFGLARRADEVPIVGQDDRTAAKFLTADGTILGTLPYMAPEQLECKSADARTDIFGFGAVLYEMITARRAFNAESQASLITKIMTEHPPPIEQFQPITPAALNRVVMKCLAKDPDERWQSAGDVASELRWIHEGGGAEMRVARPRKWQLIIASVLAVAFALALSAVLLRHPAVAKAPMIRFPIEPPPEGAFPLPFPLSNFLAVSPDGTRVVFAGRGLDRTLKLWLHDLSRGTTVALEGTDGAASPFWSPDARAIGFGTGGKLKTITLEGKNVQTICDVSGTGLYATWLGDGRILYTSLLSGSVFYTVPSSGGTPRRLFGVKGLQETLVSQPIGSTNHFIFCGANARDTDLWIGGLGGDPPRRLLDHAGLTAYDAPWLLYVREGTLYAQRFDEKNLQLTGPREPLAEGVWCFMRLGLAMASAGSDTIVYAASNSVTSIHWLDRTGHDLGEALRAGPYREQMRLSPDGRRLAVAIDDLRTGRSDIWIADIHRKSLSRFTFEDQTCDRPLWSVDAHRIAYSADAHAPPFIFVRPVEGGAARAVTKPGSIQFASDWLRDGRIFYYSSTSPTTGMDILLTTSNGDSEIWLQTPANEAFPRVSPDQRWVAYTSDDSGRDEIYVAPLDHHADRTRVSGDGGSRAAWSNEGREIYFTSTGDLYVVPVNVDGASIKVGTPSRIFSSSRQIESVEVAPDGRLLVAFREVAPTTSALKAIVGWKADLEQRTAK